MSKEQALPRIADRLLVGITGSLFAAQMPQILFALRLMRVVEEIRVVLTPSARRFVTEDALRYITRHEVLVDFDSVSRDFEMPHVDLGKWADLVLVMPATAHHLSSTAAGAADSLLNTILLGTTKPVVIVPAMDTPMWENSLTQANVQSLITAGITVVPPGDSPDVRTLQTKAGGCASLPSVLEAAAAARGIPFPRTGKFATKMGES